MYTNETNQMTATKKNNSKTKYNIPTNKRKWAPKNLRPVKTEKWTINSK